MIKVHYTCSQVGLLICGKYLAMIIVNYEQTGHEIQKAVNIVLLLLQAIITDIKNVDFISPISIADV